MARGQLLNKELVVTWNCLGPDRSRGNPLLAEFGGVDQHGATGTLHAFDRRAEGLQRTVQRAHRAELSLVVRFVAIGLGQRRLHLIVGKLRGHLLDVFGIYRHLERSFK
ncbi:hypothetical protein D3C77_615830 [compost metagenome]